MNRQRLVAVLTAGLTATAVLAGVVGLLSGDLHMSFSRTWADGVPAVAHLARAQQPKAQRPKPQQPKPQQPKPSTSSKPGTSKPDRPGTSTPGRPSTVITHGRTWT